MSNGSKRIGTGGLLQRCQVVAKGMQALLRRLPAVVCLLGIDAIHQGVQAGTVGGGEVSIQCELSRAEAGAQGLEGILGGGVGGESADHAGGDVEHVADGLAEFGRGWVDGLGETGEEIAIVALQGDDSESGSGDVPLGVAQLALAGGVFPALGEPVAEEGDQSSGGEADHVTLSDIHHVLSYDGIIHTVLLVINTVFVWKILGRLYDALPADARKREQDGDL
jgi:hypothetical protein